MFFSVRRPVGGIVVFIAVMMLAAVGSVRGATVLTEDFVSDPVAGGRAVIAGNDPNGVNRFAYSNSSHSVTAAYNTLQPAAMMRWSLGRSFNQTTSFTYSVDFNIHSAGFTADPNGFAQIAFGLINSTTTGLDRSGTPVPFGDPGTDNCYDIVTLDYFPNISPFFDSPSLQPTVTQSPTGVPGTDAFAGLLAPKSPETALNGVGESDLPRDVQLTALVTYDPNGHELVVRLNGPGGLLPIDASGFGGPGGADGDPTTMELAVPPGSIFSVDSFVIALWHDGWGNFSGDPTISTVVANVEFSNISVTDAPEPASAALVGLGVVGVLGMRRKR